MVDPPEHNIELNDPARYHCWVPKVPHAVRTWRPAHGGPLPSGVEQADGYLNIPRAQLAHEGQYICAAYDPTDDPQGRSPVDSEPVRLSIRQPPAIVTLAPAVEYKPPPPPSAPQVDPIEQTVDLGNPARIR